MTQNFTRNVSTDEFTVNVDEIAERSIVGAVVRVVAAYRGTEIRELPPIGERLDPDAFEKLMKQALDDPGRATLSVTFHYHGFEITVSSEGQMRFRPLGNLESNG